MSGIFGIFNRNAAPTNSSAMETMRTAMADWGRDGGKIWQDGCVGLGHALSAFTLEETDECLPVHDIACSVAFTCAARLDNREEISQGLGIPPAESKQLSDSQMIFKAYLKWGEDCTERFYGDWSFAAWHHKERRLFLARDHFGLTSLYYYVDRNVFAFASSRQALLTLNLAPLTFDELYLAQLITSWPSYHGERTIHPHLLRLPPAHRLRVTPHNLEVHQYWHLENTPELRLPRREEYVEAFSEVFDRAVFSTLRSRHADDKAEPLAVTLSGGLDSSSVATTAAGFLREEGRSLAAYTSVPLSDTECFVGDNFGDEFPFAAATTRRAGNIFHYPVSASSLSPIQAIRRALEIHQQPVHSAANMYWLLELNKAVRERDGKVLLIGQSGNASISWAGDVFSQPLLFQFKQLGWRRWIKDSVKRTCPSILLQFFQLYRQKHQEWWRSSAINPSFANRLNLLERRLSDPKEFAPKSPIERRSFIKPGRSIVGALHAEMGAAFGLQMRDPTGDARVLAFSYSVPDHIFIDPVSGIDRWLVREAMKGRLPDEVRLNRNRGRQAGDLVPRLRRSAVEIEAVLTELTYGPAAAYVNVPYMRQVWQLVKTEDTPEAFKKAVTVLTRGIMAGLFVNGLSGKGTSP